MADPTNVEVWRNSANGPRWYTVFDTQGREVQRVVQGGRSFTLSVFERRVNQDKAATPDLDHFRDSTFVLTRGAEDTDLAEIGGTNALTDSELEQIVNDVLGDPQLLDEVLAGLTSAQALNRLLEYMVAEDAPSTLIEKTREAFNVADGGVKAVKRRVVSAGAPSSDG